MRLSRTSLSGNRKDANNLKLTAASMADGIKLEREREIRKFRTGEDGNGLGRPLLHAINEQQEGNNY